VSSWLNKTFLSSRLNKTFVSSWLILLLSLPAFAGTVTFTDTVRVVMGSRESQDEVRVYATQEAKRCVLDKVGVYLSGSTEIVRKVQESFSPPLAGGQGGVSSSPHTGASRYPLSSSSSSFLDTTSVLQRIQTLTVGVVQTEVVSEEWKTEGGSFVLYLVCRVKVDPEDALNRLTELLKDKEKVEDYQKVQFEVERLRTELAQLRKDLESAKSERETKAVKEEVQTAINGLTAQDWFQKGLAATEPDDQIACFSLALQLEPKWKGAWGNRGIAYRNKGDYLRSIEDFNIVLKITPEDSMIYGHRGFAYFMNCDYRLAISDFSRQLEITPNDTMTLFCRGLTYNSVNEYTKAIIDFNRALAINPRFARVYLVRGETFRIMGEQLKAKRDFQKALELGDEEAKRKLEEMR